jgi:cysteinyl-tRNA synthetase
MIIVHILARSFESAAIQQALFVDKLFKAFFETVQACQKGLVDISTLSEVEAITRINNAQDEIIDVLANNFDTPSVMTQLQELVHWINSHMNYEKTVNYIPTCALHLAVDFIQSWLDIFGIDMSTSGHENQVGIFVRFV